MRAKATDLANAMASLDPGAFEPGAWRLFVAEVRRCLDTVEAEYARAVAGVDVAWLAQATGSTVRLAKQHAEVGAALEASPVLAGAVRAGEVALENVAVLSAVAAHPGFEASPLVDAAAVLSPPRLRAAVEQWRAQVDRVAVETHAQACHRRRSLKFCTTMEGMVRVEGLLEAEAGRVFRKAIDHLVDGQRLDNSGRTPEQRRADAAFELAAAQNAGTIAGGRERPQLLVTIDVEHLEGRTGGRALLDTGETITIEAARRLACDANIAPVLMKGRSEVLDLGRSKRVVSNAQYNALVVRDKGCRFPGCDRPPGWCQAHHLKHWIDRGKTDLNNLALFCHTHHHLFHDQHWRIAGNAANLKIHPPGGVGARAG